MTDMPERIWVTQECGDFKPNFRRFHASSLDHGPDYPEYTRSDLVPTWNRDLSAAPFGSRVIIATSCGLVLEARRLCSWDGDEEWESSNSSLELDGPIAWQPLPRHPDEAPDAGSGNGGGG